MSTLNADGSWTAPDVSGFRSLTAQEVADTQQMARDTTPEFGGEHNAEWEQHHPVARAVWEQRGLKPVGK